MKNARVKVNSEASVPKKRQKLSLNGTTKDTYITTDYIYNAYIEDMEIKTISKGYVPPNTEENTKWALKCFNEQRYTRNEIGKTIDKCLDDLLEVQCPEALNKWIATFIAEVCCVDGERYSSKRIHQLLSGILRYMGSCTSNSVNILDRKDTYLIEVNPRCV